MSELSHSFWFFFIYLVLRYCLGASNWVGSGGVGCMHVFCTVRAEKAPKIRREHLPHQQSGAGGTGAAGEHGGGRGRQQDGG